MLFRSKSLKTDHVRLRRGTDEEAEAVRWIFRQFVIEEQLESEIARQLEQAGVSNGWEIPWSAKMVDTILKNENYIGNIVYNRTSQSKIRRIVGFEVPMVQGQSLSGSSSIALRRS